MSVALSCAPAYDRTQIARTCLGLHKDESPTVVADTPIRISFAECSKRINELHQCLQVLEQRAAALHLPRLKSHEWFQLLEQKLVPQMSDSAFLVAAVVGGTNIGKSVVFNHLAGTRASSTSPTASGTKHPVCLIPPGFDEQHELSSIFPGFKLTDWANSDGALTETSDDLLFWRTSDRVAGNLLVLDTPDIDSDARINWERADKIRRAADVLIAVLTQQKYNDAAVKEFFRRAAAEDKFVIVVFNQVHLPDDEEYWPLWLKTFSEETRIIPEFLYLAPHDRRAAEENRLVFYERRWPPSAAKPIGSGDAAEDVATTETAREAEAAARGIATQAGHRLHEDLSSLRFGEIKLRTLRSSLDLLLRAGGVPSWLAAVSGRSGEYRMAAELLSTHKLAEIDNWPTLPTPLIINEIRTWWQGQREGWSAKVHGFYNKLGDGIGWTFRKVASTIQSPKPSKIDEYKKQEWKAILDAIDEVYGRLTWFKELGNPLLQPRLQALLGATTRQSLLDDLKAQHEAWDVETQLRALINSELEGFRNESPQFYKSLRQLDSVAAAVRPATSIVLFIAGFGPMGDMVGQVATQTALSSALTAAGDVAAGSVTAAVGETWISNTTSTGFAWLEAKFRRIHVQFVKQRAAWLADAMQSRLLGTLPEELGEAAVIPESQSFVRIQELLKELKAQLEMTG